MTARPYQQTAHHLTTSAWERGQRNVLIVMATGLGKTHFACDLMGQPDCRSLFIVPTDEIAGDTVRRLTKKYGRHPELEKAESWATRHGTADVVASMQTLWRQERRETFAPDTFGRIIFDEAHYSVTKKNIEVLEYFEPAFKVGLTATPNRHDKKALGKRWDYCPMVYPIAKATNDGWLCPVRGSTVELGEIDFAGLKAKRDFSDADVEREMTKKGALVGVAKAAIDHALDKPALVFCATVKHAEMMAEIINDYCGKVVAACVHQKTPKKHRREIVKRFKACDGIQYLCNVGVFTTGFDFAGLHLIVNARLTKSVGLLTQILGRITRTNVDGDLLNEAADAYARMDLIARSDKPYGNVIDFTGRMGKHRLATIEDALGGSYSDVVKAKAKRKRDSGAEPDVLRALEIAQAEAAFLAEVAAGKRGWFTPEVKYAMENFDIYNGRLSAAGTPANRPTWKPPGDASEKQKRYIWVLARKTGRKVTDEFLDGLSKKAAGAIISQWQGECGG